MEGNLDGEEIRAVAMLAKEGKLSKKERAEALRELMEDGLSISDILELNPNLLRTGPATLAETDSGNLPPLGSLSIV